MKTILGKQSEKLEITKDNWCVSLVRKKRPDKDNSHCFLIIEGVDANDNKVFKKAQLVYAKHKDECDKECYDSSRGAIIYQDTSVKELCEDVDRDLIARSYQISRSQKERLEERIIADQINGKEIGGIPYNKGGNASMMGLFGDSLVFSGLGSVRESSVVVAEICAKKDQSCGQSSLASVRRGHNCLSWAIEVLGTVVPDLKLSFVTKFAAVIPEVELPDEKATGWCSII